MRTAGWCMVFLGMAAGLGLTRSAAAAENTAATQTTLAVATDNAGPRTRVTLTAHVTAPGTGAALSGVVNFRSREMDLGSAFLDSEGNASLQTASLPAGSHQVVAIYKGASGFLSSLSSSAQVQANVSAVAGFSVSASPTSLTTPVGGFVTSVITVTPVNGFNAYVSLSCNGLPYDATCSFTPLSVSASCITSGTTETCTPATSVMQIQTLAPSGSVSNAVDSGTMRYVFVFPALFGLAGLGACKRRAWRNLAHVLLVFAAMMAMTACSQRYNYLNHGPPYNTGTPTGNYTITVEAQSSTANLTTTPPSYPQITLSLTGN
jgi:hypothetical protein